MKKILVIHGSVRSNGNSAFLLDAFLEGAHAAGAQSETVKAHELNLEYCTGCLRCNMIKRCAIRGDEWPELSRKITEADVLVFAAPIYFHHLPAQVKKIIDRFRSFVHVQITPSGLKHTPHVPWEKTIVLLLPLGSSDLADAEPVAELFKFMTRIMGEKNQLRIIPATRLGVAGQVGKTLQELEILYPKMGLPAELAIEDAPKNLEITVHCRKLGYELCRSSGLQ